MLGLGGGDTFGKMREGLGLMVLSANTTHRETERETKAKNT